VLSLASPLAAAARLPREARDTLFLLAVIGWIVLLQTGHIPLWCSLMAAGVLAWRTVLTLRGAPLPGWVWRVGLLLLAIAATALTHRTLVGRDAGVTLIVVLLALKTLELRARRDAFVVFFLGFFTLLTHFFYSQSLLTAAGILVALMGLLTALVNAHMPVGRPSLWQAARVAGGMALLGAPIMLALFLLFPRMAPLWGLPADENSGRSGLSNEMRVGQIAQLVLDDRIAMRVRFEGPPPPANRLYFRGPVLSDFNGVEWKPLNSDFPRSLGLSPDLRVSGEPVRYEVTLEPNDKPWVLLLDAAVAAPEVPGTQARMTPELQWVTRRAIGSLVRYRAESYLDFRHGPGQPVLGLQDYLQLPGGFNPRTHELAVTLRREHGAGPDAAPALVQAALDRLRTGDYRYTLEPGVYGQHTADEFWFDRREGFCEHIASAFVVLMRAMDIPARIVTGYQGGEMNGVDGYWTVRQRDAHAWAEVWLQGQGWVRVDPTGAVAPGRIGSLQRLSAPEGAVAGAIRTLNPTLVAQLRATWEAINNRWNQWVLNYTQGEQLNLLRALGFDEPDWADLAYTLIGLMVLASGLGALWNLWERQRQDPWLRLLDQARQRLHRAGLALPARATPRALATAVQQQCTDQAKDIASWLLDLEAQRYAKEPSADLRRLRAAFKQLHWPKRPSP